MLTTDLPKRRPWASGAEGSSMTTSTSSRLSDSVRELSKLCAKCGSPYTGFGGTCGPCRKLGKEGSMVQCEQCRSFHVGYKEMCDECFEKTQEAYEDPELAVKLLLRSQGKANAAQVLAALAEQDLGQHRKSIVEAGGVTPLVRVLVTSSDVEARSSAARALIGIASESKENRRCIGEAATVEEFLALLRSRGEEESTDIQLIAAQGLKVAAILPPNKQAIVDKGGLSMLVDRLRRWDEEGQACICWTLNNIIIGSTARKTAVFKAGAVPLLIRVLKAGNSEGRIGAAATLQNLAVVPALRDFIIDIGAIGPLVELLREGTELGQIKACDALRNLALGSDARAATITQSEDAVPLLVKIWETGCKEAKKSAADALKELAHSSPLRLRSIAVAGGAGALARDL